MAPCPARRQPSVQGFRPSTAESDVRRHFGPSNNQRVATESSDHPHRRKRAEPRGSRDWVPDVVPPPDAADQMRGEHHSMHRRANALPFLCHMPFCVRVRLRRAAPTRSLAPDVRGTWHSYGQK